MSSQKKIKTALVSVYHKDGLDEILKTLYNQGVQFISTGGTHSFIQGLGMPCQAVEDITSYPSILGGRVKTLHPKIFGGILSRRDLPEDVKQVKSCFNFSISIRDAKVMYFYGFTKTVNIVLSHNVLCRRYCLRDI